MAKASSAGGAPTFDEMVREKEPVTLGEAKQFATALPPEQRKCACGCYVCYSPSCPACCLGLSCLLNFCGACLMYNPFLCACPDDTPGAWTCTDMKGVMYFLIPVDDKGTLGFFSEHSLQGQGDALKVGCYCSKLC